MKNKGYDVIISECASDMLIQHVRLLAVVSPDVAWNFKEEIIHSSQSLQVFPERNPWLIDPHIPANKYRKMVVNKRYLLIYQIRDNSVYIDYIVDCRQNYQWLS